MQPSLTLIIIAPKIDRDLTRYLQAVKKFYDELLVIDTSTTGPITDFAKLRNEALSQATSTWVVFLDSDERISREDFAELKEQIAQTTADGLYLCRSDVFYNQTLQFGEWGRVPILRAMRRAAATYHGVVHEVASISGSVESTTVTILHYAHLSITEFVAKVSRYAALAAAARQASLFRLGAEICVYPIAKFILNYGIRRGFLDGWRGLAYATLMSLHSFFVRAYGIAEHLRHENHPTT